MSEPEIRAHSIATLKDARIIILSNAAMAGFKGKANYQKWLVELDEQIAQAILFISNEEYPNEL